VRGGYVQANREKVLKRAPWEFHLRRVTILEALACEKNQHETGTAKGDNGFTAIRRHATWKFAGICRRPYQYKVTTLRECPPPEVMQQCETPDKSRRLLTVAHCQPAALYWPLGLLIQLSVGPYQAALTLYISPCPRPVLVMMLREANSDERWK
jgi:hypothetical protein